MDEIREIKVKKCFISLKKGKLKLRFTLQNENESVERLYLKLRSPIYHKYILFELEKGKKGYQSVLRLEQCEFELGFWDIVAVVKDTDKESEAVLGGLSMRQKIKLICRPRWQRVSQDYILYPFINGARQFTIQYRRYHKGYDSNLFIWKEYLALFCYFILKPFWDKKEIWLVCEKFCGMAQDNGFYFFQYCMEHLSEQEKKHILYVIDKSVPDYRAVENYNDHVIQFMSFRYMIYLSAAKFLVSSDAIRHFYIWDSPNSIFKVLYQLRKPIIFLQHGVMYFKRCERTFRKSGGNRMTLFVTSSEREKAIICRYFEYDPDEVIVTGLPRWDVLKDKSDTERKEILLMPTWRSWLEDVENEKFIESDYFKAYTEFLTDERLIGILKREKIKINFYIHPKFRDYIRNFQVDHGCINVISFGERPLNELIMSCHMMVTDYSSAAWDVYYQGKPIVFYMFDLDTYEELQGSYIDMKKDCFGDKTYQLEELIDAISKYIQNNFQEDLKYKQMRKDLLTYMDDKNSERIYREINKLHVEHKLWNKIKKRLP